MMMDKMKNARTEKARESRRKQSDEGPKECVVDVWMVALGRVSKSCAARVASVSPWLTYGSKQINMETKMRTLRGSNQQTCSFLDICFS